MKKIIISIIVIILAGLAVWYFFPQSKQPEKYTGPVEKITIGYYPSSNIALLFVAEDQGFFSQEGLSVTLKEYFTGVKAMTDMLKKEVDMATVGDMGFVVSSFKRDDPIIFTTIGIATNDFRVVGRKDKVTNPQDLKGKHIATPKGTQIHFFLYLTLLKYGLSVNDINLTLLEGAETLAKGLADGEFDAISAREPIIDQAKKLLQDNAIIFEEPGLFRATANLATLKSTAAERPESMEKILRALIKAEKFTKQYPEQSIDIVSKTINASKSSVTANWQQMELRLSLDQSLLLTLEDEARFAIKSNLFNATEIPNYLDYIYLDALEAVKPEAMTIIR